MSPRVSPRQWLSQTLQNWSPSLGLIKVRLESCSERERMMKREIITVQHAKYSPTKIEQT